MTIRDDSEQARAQAAQQQFEAMFPAGYAPHVDLRTPKDAERDFGPLRMKAESR
jgi:hypothetical protein